jgi:hypothetical protein
MAKYLEVRDVAPYVLRCLLGNAKIELPKGTTKKAALRLAFSG